MLSSKTLLVAFAGVLATACQQSPRATTQIVAAGQPPIGKMTDSAVVPVGVIVGFSVVGSAATNGPLTATLDDATHVSLKPSVTPGTYVLVGLSPGATTLRAVAGDADPTTMPVVVVDQTRLP
jgi:hypothetical protein